MAKYRKKPIVVEAEQFILGKHVPNGVFLASPGEYFIHTLEGALAVRNRDYVITGIKGEKYSCREDIFLETYEEEKI